MRNPNRKKIGEILQKLKDDQSHTTRDLFPEVVGDAVIELCERVIRLGQLGLMTHEPPVTTGIDEVVRAVWGVRITPEGHRWLERERALRRYAEGLFAKKVDLITEEHQKRERAIKADFAKHGMVQSGGFFKTLAEAGIRRINALARARVESIFEAFEKASAEFDRCEADEISAQVGQQCDVGKGTLLNVLSHHAQRINFNVSGFQSALEGEIGRGVEGIKSAIRRDIELKLDEAILGVQREVPPAPGVGEEKSWDAFISYASEDDKGFVLPLAHRLKNEGLRVWYAPLTLKVGDSLRRSIDLGLARSRFGIVVLSPSFFAKEWPQRELDGLVAKEIDHAKVILPVWHGVSRDFVVRFSPTLADRLAANSADGLDEVVTKLLDTIRPTPKQTQE